MSGLRRGVNGFLAILGCYATVIAVYRRFGTSHQSNLQGTRTAQLETFRNSLLVPSSEFKQSKCSFYRRLGTACWSHLQGSSSPSVLVTDVSGQRFCPIFRVQAVEVFFLPTFRDSLLVPSSGFKRSKCSCYRRFGTAYWSHLQDSSSSCVLVADVSGQIVSKRR